MTSTGEFEQEKLELERIINSGIFSRAPNLALVLNYVCSRYFEHEGEQIKEYNIAVEALHRPAEFDPRADSIVRVEAHRLRKRLKEYYESEGAHHGVQIQIPAGQYAPRFLFQTTEQGTPAGTVEEAAPSAPLTEGPPGIATTLGEARRPTRLRKIWLGLAAILVAGAIFPIARLSRGDSRPRLPEPIAAAAADTIRIACGLESGNYIDQFGNTWSADAFFQEGTANHGGLQPIRGTRDQRLYNSRREGAFRYDIPLKPGVYELRLHFAETVYGANNPAGGGESSRVFSVMVNGRDALPNFDVTADGDASTADIKVLKDVSPAADGRVHLRFTPVSNMPILSAIEITPGVAGRMRPIRMVAQDHAYTDKQGRSWEPDRYAFGGQLVARNNAITGGADPDLYHGERFGNITYVVPVATDGHYRVVMHFSERWFGPGKAGGGPGAGDREFDILCNGVAVRRNFDIFKEAGGMDKAVSLDVADVTPNHQGKIVISLIPVKNYASINAIEVVDETK